MVDLQLKQAVAISPSDPSGGFSFLPCNYLIEKASAFFQRLLGAPTHLSYVVSGKQRKACKPCRDFVAEMIRLTFASRTKPLKKVSAVGTDYFVTDRTLD